MANIVAVTAIDGAQQSSVARAFGQHGWMVRGTKRKAGPANGTYPADLATGQGLDEAFAGARAVAFSLPQDHRQGAMTRMTEQVVAAAGRAGVERLVVNVAGTIDDAGDGLLAVELRAVRDVVRAAPVPWVILQPTVFMDNLLAPWALPGIVGDGVLAYPAPEQAAISWLSHRSLAEFVVAAASRPEARGRDLRIGGPQSLTGGEVADVLAARLHRPVVYHRIPLDGFAVGMNQAMGAPAGDRIASLYARLDGDADAWSVGSEARDLLGVEPETFAVFVARHEWTPARQP